MQLTKMHDHIFGRISGFNMDLCSLFYASLDFYQQENIPEFSRWKPSTLLTKGTLQLRPMLF